MKVALINHYPPQSGAGRYAYGLYSALKNKNVDCHMICMNPMQKEDLYEEVNKEVIFLDKFSYSHHPSLSKLLFYFVNPFRIPKSYDLYHMTGQMLSKYAKFNHPAIVSVHDIYPYKYREEGLPFLYNVFAKRCVTFIKYADRIIASSNYTKETITKTFGINPDKIEVIYFGLDHQLFKPREKRVSRERLGLPFSKRIVLHVGNETPRKNIPSLLEAFYLLQRDLSNVILVRVGEKKRSTKTLIRRLNLRKSILYFNEVSDKELTCFYNAADLFVFPSIREGFGSPPLEAMASGCPVIASNQTSIPEVVGGGGILIDPFDIDRLFLHMKRILENKSLSQELSERGIRRAAEFSWEKCAQETLAAYQEVKMERERRRN